jgi:calcineurin-like phosphoesterase family protein
MSIWLSSDTHFNHGRLLFEFEKENRRWETLDDMNSGIINNFNAMIQPSDLLIHLGDWSMGMKEQHHSFRARMPYEIWLISGNHDRSRQFSLETVKFDRVYDSLNIRYRGKRFHLRHEPHDNLDIEFDCLLHGHVHSEYKSKYDTKGRWCYNVGVDANGMLPVSLDYIVDMLK